MTPVAYLYWVLLATLLPTLPSFSFQHRDSRLGGSSGLFQGNRPGEPGSPIASSQGVLIVRLFATFCYLLYRHKVQIITRKAEGLYYSSIFCELRCDQMVLWDFCWAAASWGLQDCIEDTERTEIQNAEFQNPKSFRTGQELLSLMLGLEVLFFCYYRYKRAMLQVS